MKMKSLLDIILAPGGLYPVFQPIFEFGNNSYALYAVEGLIRGPKETPMEMPDILFEYVRRKGEEKAVDRACLSLILEEAGRHPAGVPVSVNVHALTLGKDKEFASYISETAQANSIDPSNLIIEIVEHAPFWDESGLRDTLRELRDMGVKIALDDIGNGQSNYRMLLDCRPDYFKIDRYIVDSCYTDPLRQSVLGSILKIASEFGARVIAEGAEKTEDVATLLHLGIDLIQGFLLARPMKLSDVMEKHARTICSSQNLQIDVDSLKGNWSM